MAELAVQDFSRSRAVLIGTSEYTELTPPCWPPPTAWTACTGCSPDHCAAGPLSA